MFIYVEQWTPKQAWLDLSAEERKAFLEAIVPLLQKHEEMGIETLAMAGIDADTPSKSKHAYFSVLRMPDQATAKTFEQDIAATNWYEYFEQTNSRGQIRKPEEVIGEHIEM